MEFSRTAEGKFLRANNAQAISALVASGFKYHVAEAGGEIVGFVGVRDNCHLYHLFVAEQVQRQGLARRLWTVAKSACYAAGNRSRFTVNSSNNAIPVYESFGFTRAAPTQDSGGVLYNPMVLVDVDGQPLHRGDVPTASPSCQT
ncbi:MAG: GNAT family N-acetyltransferase [Glaciimonas sp.]|nr:GNAT family N-acetyltransferase [Glaciimonas sp.]